MAVDYYKIDRTVIAISGADRLSFLQGLVTQDLNLITAEQKAVYTCLLTPQGKFDFDFFVYDDAAEARYLVDIEHGREEVFCATLKKFKLRSQVQFEICPDIAVYATFTKPENDFEYIFKDTRHDTMGWRIFSKQQVLTTASQDYDARRMKLALPDGQKDIQIGLESLAEVGLADAFAVCYTKGCFMGQELTARMKYRGLLKKKLCPIEGDHLHTNNEIFYEGRLQGTIRSVINGYGLAVLPIDLINAGATLTTQDGYSVKIRAIN